MNLLNDAPDFFPSIRTILLQSVAELTAKTKLKKLRWRAIVYKDMGYNEFQVKNPLGGETAEYK